MRAPTSKRPFITDSSDYCSPAFDGTPPPHFYGQLVKTAEGCDILRDSGHFDLFTEVIQQHEEFALDHDYVVQLKSVLWAVVRLLPTGRLARSPALTPC